MACLSSLVYQMDYLEFVKTKRVFQEALFIIFRDNAPEVDAFFKKAALV